MFHKVSSDLVQRQLENEESIIDRGIQKYRKALQAAADEGRMADTLPGRWLTSNFIEPIAGEIRKFIYEPMEGKPGPDAIGVGMLTQFEPDVYAYITLRTILNSILDGRGACEKTKIQSRIARELREEMQHAFMAKEKTQTYKYWMREAERAPDRRTKQRCLARLKRNFPDTPRFKSEAEQLALSAACVRLIYIAVNTTGIARIEQRNKLGRKHLKTPDFLVLNPEFRVKLNKMNTKAESLWPKFEPMLCPPRPWNGAFGGGFVGKLGERTVLVRTGNRDYLDEIHHGIQDGKMGRVLRALNAIQATPWRVNRRILGVMRAAFEAGGKAYGLPGREKIPDPDRPADIKTNKEAAKGFVNKLKAAQRHEARRESKHWAVSNMLRTAETFKDEDAIWFAHNLDWRGRIYPMSSYLSPQGEELHRALLEFADGLPLETDEAVEWLAIHGAGCWGYDKVSFDDRVKWVHEHEEQIRNSAGDPLEYTWWTEADKPWMFLAWCIDWVGYLEDGKLHVSRLPVAMDGSCNGLQNFAAMLRHEETAIAVNLAPSEKPNDIYQQVADKLKPRIKALAESEAWTTEEILPHLEERNRLEYADKDANPSKKDRKISPEERRKTADMWDVVAARWIWPHIDRKMVKRPVMTYPYSVTLYGIRDQLIEVLLDLHGAGKTSYPVEHIGKVAMMLRRYVHEAIQETVVAAARAMKWLQEAAKVVAEGNLPVKWESPVGMLVLQNYRQSKKSRVRIHCGSARYEAAIYVDKIGSVSKSKQTAGIAPNFVHSCDASHLMLTVVAGLDAGISEFHMIHDSYGTHARNAATLAKTLREQFVTIYGEQSNLQNFFAQLKEQLNLKPELAAKMVPPPMPSNFDLNLVLESKYFFA